MRIEHVALWVADLERSRNFYETYFGARSGALYESARRPFRSYFLSFDSGARLEVMAMPGIEGGASDSVSIGWAHIAVSVGSRREVDVLTARLAGDGYQVLSMPRVTGDGYYESTVRDPDGNTVEIIE